MESKETLIEGTAAIFRQKFSREPEQIVAAPGRANLIGEHTDYNDGHVLPIAIDRYIVAAASNRQDRVFKLHAANFKESFEFDMDAPPTVRPHWVSYMMGVIVELEREAGKFSGKEIVAYGDLPVNAGLSSSAAVEISTATAIERLEGFDLTDKQVVNVCRRADHNFVGINSGPMDQFASRACRAGYAGLLDCRTLEMTYHKLPQNISFLLVYSGIPRALATSEYNERQASCQNAVEILRVTNHEIQALRDATPEMVDSLRDQLGERIYRRARHVVTEQKRVFDVVEAFAQNDNSLVGEILLQGHRSLSLDYEVSLPILDEMIEWFYRRPEVVGARLTGAGFGGSMICLVEPQRFDLKEFKDDFIKNFAGKTPESPDVWVINSVDGAKHQPPISGYGV